MARVTGVSRATGRTVSTRLTTVSEPRSRAPRIAAGIGAAVALMAAGWFGMKAVSMPSPSPVPVLSPAPVASPELEAPEPLIETLHKLAAAQTPFEGLPREDDEWSEESASELERGCIQSSQRLQQVVKHLQDHPEDMKAAEWVNAFQYLGALTDVYAKYRLLLEDPPNPWNRREWSTSPRKRILAHWPALLAVLEKPELQPIGGAVRTLLASHRKPAKKNGKPLGDREHQMDMADSCDEAVTRLSSLTDPCLKGTLTICFQAHARVHVQQNLGFLVADTTVEKGRIAGLEAAMLVELAALERACPSLPSEIWHGIPLYHLHGVLCDRVKAPRPPDEILAHARRVNELMGKLPGTASHDDIQKLDELLKKHKPGP
jgi:hypothetical protein